MQIALKTTTTTINQRKTKNNCICTMFCCCSMAFGLKKNNGNINYISDIVKFVTLNASHLTNKHKTISRDFFPFFIWLNVRSFHLSILGLQFCNGIQNFFSLFLFVLVVSFIYHLVYQANGFRKFKYINEQNKWFGKKLHATKFWVCRNHTNELYFFEIYGIYSWDKA